MIAELKKIELRKKEREKKTQDLQKLITAADSNIDSRKAEKKKASKKIPHQHKIKETTGVSGNSLYFGTFDKGKLFLNKHTILLLMSQCMRFPTIWYVQPAKPQISLPIHAV